MEEWIKPPKYSNKASAPSPEYTPLFPKDHGAHRGYGLEWWYWIGHLQTLDGEKKFGFQSTVFRLAGDPYDSNYSIDQLWKSSTLSAHAALSDLNDGRYIHHERVMRKDGRGKWGQIVCLLK